MSRQTGAVDISGTVGTVAGDIVGGNKGLDEAQTVARLVDELQARGLIATAQSGGLERRTIITLAQRLKPAERLDLDQAVTELERAVGIAVDVINRGERGTHEDSFIAGVLKPVSGRIQHDDLDGGAKTIDAALADDDAAFQRRRVLLLKAGIKVETLRRDQASVARRIKTGPSREVRLLPGRALARHSGGHATRQTERTIQAWRGTASWPRAGT